MIGRNASLTLVLALFCLQQFSGSLTLGTYNASLSDIGVLSVSFSVETNLSSSFLENCLISKEGANEALSCSSNPGASLCDCNGDIIVGLESNTEYTLSLKKGFILLDTLAFKTASTGTLSVTKEYYYFNFTVEYPQMGSPPSSCFPCIALSSDEIDTEKCKELIMERETPSKPEFCNNYDYNVTNSATSYDGLLTDTILLDNQYNYVGEMRDVAFPSTNITQTDLELFSASYLIETDIPLDPDSRCQFKNDNSFTEYFYCELSDGTVTQDCPCDVGKLVRLPTDAFNYFTVYQGPRRIGFSPIFYTAYKGDFEFSNIGLFSMEYSISYGYQSYPPDICTTCLVPVSDLMIESCDDHQPVTDSQGCSLGSYSNLRGGTLYNLLILDGDSSTHTNQTFTTEELPSQTLSQRNKTSVHYQLVYGESYFPPTGCHVYFKENPFYPVTCEMCDCVDGTVILPTENKTLSTVVIANRLGETLAVITQGSSLSGGAIAGIVIAVLVVVAVIVGASTFLIIRGKSIHS